jgi:glucose-1-phosphate thymidylyltransferase
VDLLFLSAGFATRLEPLTLNQPKHLLPVKDGLFVDRLIDQLQKVSSLFDKKVLITNDRYFKSFIDWQANTDFKVEILSDGVKQKENKIGAIGDLVEAISQADLKNDLLVIAMDFIFLDFDFKKLIDFVVAHHSSAIVVRKEDEIELLKAGSCVELSRDGQVINFEEKPAVPFSNLYGVPYYFIKKEDLSLIAQIDKNLWDNSGQLASKIASESVLYGYRYDGEYLHMTNIDDYNRIREM